MSGVLIVSIHTCLLYECTFMPLVLTAMNIIDRSVPDANYSSTVTAERILNCEYNCKYHLLRSKCILCQSINFFTFIGTENPEICALIFSSILTILIIVIFVVVLGLLLCFLTTRRR